jgi:hypothetical protein
MQVLTGSLRSSGVSGGIISAAVAEANLQAA